ncbi:MAG: hypothetical protein GX038_05695 [Erysipelothrix sp.]|nr:hypothetical protein [Erysipelothrix sp.]
MNINQIMYFGLKIIIPFLYTYAYLKFNRAKKVDSTLKFKLKGRSQVEFYLVLFISMAFIMYPAKKDSYGTFVFIGAILFLWVYLMLERMIFVGRKVIYAKYLAFEVKMITKRYYEKGSFVFYIRGGRVKTFLPVTDIDYITQTLSGRIRRSK